MESTHEIGPVIEPGHDYASVTESIARPVLTRHTKKAWWIGFAISFLVLQLLLVSVVWLFAKGVGIWGNNIPVGWGFDIINLVWWIGIGHAGTFISAILLLLRQEWRTSINRFAEAMTLFAVANASLFPLLHTGRPWFGYYIFPYPNTMGLWPQPRSPLVWDAFAIGTYATVSILFWAMGLIPDLATLRDTAKSPRWRMLYGLLAMGWRGSARHWQRFQSAYLLMAAIATPLVISVHSIIGLDFAYSIIPGWHSTVFPPYFVAGAVFSGFAMVLTLIIPLRKLYHLEDFITMRHIHNMAKFMLAMGLIVAYGYLMELFIAWYSGDVAEIQTYMNRFTGEYWFLYFGLILFNVIVPQALWSFKARSNLVLLWVISVLINVGMYLERFIIIVTGLYHDYLPSSWHIYIPTVWDASMLLGTIGLFLTLVFLFVRFLPSISIFEMRELVHHHDHAEEKGEL